MGALLSALHVLRGPTGDDPVIRQELLGGMEKELYRMQPMLDDLAQLHGQVLGAIILNRISIDMNDWLSPTILPWRAQALEKGLEWVPQIPANLPTLEIDPDRMAQVIGNLLSNAIKIYASWRDHSNIFQCFTGGIYDPNQGQWIWSFPRRTEKNI